MVQLSLSTETNFPGDLNALVEDQGTVLTVRFELDEPAPAGGLRVFLDSTETEILNRLDFAQLVSDFFAGVGVENIVAFPSPQRNDDRSGLALTIAAGAESASFQINVLNQEEADPPQRPYDGLLPVEFSLITADQIPVEDQGTITGVGDYTVDQSAASSTVLFADTESQLPSTTPGYDEAVSGDISGDPNNPLLLPLTEGTTTLSATTGGGISDQEYVTVTIPEGFQLDSLVLASFSTPGNPGFIGVQEGSTFTEPLDNSANRGNFLGYLTFGSEVGTDILDDIGRGNGAIGFDGPLPSGTYTFALQQIQGSTDYTLEFNVSEVTNTDPEAENDSYSVATNQTLDIDAVAGVLFNDSDADQDSLTAAIETLPDNGSVTLNPDGSFSYTPDTDFAGIDTFTYTVSDGNDGSDTAEVSINVGQLPIVSFEAIPATISEEGTAEERLLRLEFNVVGDIPEGGLFILFESLFGITDQMDGGSDAGDFNNLGLVPPFDRENNIIGVRLDANQAEMLLPIVNDLTEEGTTTFDFALAPGEGYIIDPDQNATSFTITDDNGGPGVGPTIALSVSETNLAEGDPLTVNFDVVAGEIPPEGVDVLVQSTVPAALGQFDLSNLDDLVLSGVTNVRPGDTRGLSFIATLTDPNASITLDIFDDIIAEDPIELPFTLVNGELYEVDPTAESVTLTVSDDIDIPGPTVGITLDRSDVVEGETIVLTINTTGEIPDGGLQVLINDVESAANGLRSLTEFNISGVQFTGIEGFPLPAEGDSGFFVTVSDPVATITLPIFDDQADEIEEEEVFTFAVIDGEAYGVDPDAPDVTLSIADPPNELPTVSISTTTPEVTEDEAPEARVTLTVDGEIPNDGQGVVVTIGGEGVEKLFAPRFLDGSVPIVFEPADGVVALGFTGTEVILGLLEPEVTSISTIFNDIVEELPDVLEFEILPSDDYTIGQGTVSIGVEDGPSATPGEGPTVSLSVTETELKEGEEFTVNITVDESTGAIPAGGLELFIDSGATALGEFNIFGDDGIDPDTDLVGIAGFPEQGDDLGGFFVTVIEPEASITLSVFDQDGPNEGEEELTFSLADGEIYEVVPDAQDVTLTISDGGEDAEYVLESGVTSVYLDFDLLEDVAGISLVSADSDATPENRPFLPPELQFQVGFGITDETDFSFAPVGFVPLGGSIEHDGTITLAVGETQVTVGEFSIGYNAARASERRSGFFVADTLDDALGLGILFDLGIPATAEVSGIDGDDLNLGDADLLLSPELAGALGNADLAGADVGDARVDAMVEALPPVVSISTTTPLVSEDENPVINLTFTVDGPIPFGGVPFTIGGDFTDLFVPRLLDGNVATVIDPEDGLIGVANRDPEFDVLLTAPEVVIEASIFDDIIEEVDQVFELEIFSLDGSVIGNSVASFTIVDGDSVIPGSGPTVTLSVSDTELIEGEEFTVFFDVDETTGAIPAGGLQLFVDSGATDLGEFNIFGENGIDPETDLVGIAGFPEQGDDLGGFFVTVVEPSASITLSVFEDGPNEGLETINFSLANGEQYEVTPDGQDVTLTINDGGEGAEYDLESGVTSVYLDFDLLEDVAGISLVSADSDVEPEDRFAFLPEFQVGFEITDETDFRFEPVGFVPVGGSIEHAGTITLAVGEAQVTVGEFSIGYNAARASERRSGFFVADTLDDALGLGILFDLGIPETAAVSGIDGDDLNLGDADLLLSPELAGALGNADLAGADVGDARVDGLVSLVLPSVSVSITPDTVIENEDGASFTGTFTVDGNIPPVAFDADGNYVAGGLSVFLDVKEVFELANQFDTFIETNLTFGSSEAAASQPNIFELILFEETSELTITIFDDIIEEEPFTYNFELVDDLEGSDYIVNPDANTGSFVLEDGLPGGPGVGPDVGVSVTESELFEGEEFTVNFTVTGDAADIPSEDNPLTVLVSSDTPGALGEFALFDENGTPLFSTEGIAGVPTPGDGIGSSFFVDLIAPTASLTLEVFDDGPGEGVETFDFELANGEVYEVDPDNAGVTLTIDDTAPALVPNFGSLDGDTIEGVGSNELTFGGAGDDLIDTVGGTGGNRLYGQSGDDTFILGSDDRALGGAGDDRFFLLGGDNTITGGQDMDQFWIAVADIPPAANTITDFESGEDVIGVAGLGIGFDELGITQQGDDTLISLGDDELAKLLGVTASDLTAADFAFADSVTV